MRLINADKIHPDVRTQRGALAISQGQLAYAKTVNAILIPNGATNGDMIMAMLQIKDEDIKAKNSCVTNQVIEYIIDTGNYLLRFDSIFWDAPYKGGKEE